MDENIVGVAFWLFVLVLIIFFAGEPDIHDAIIHYLMNRGG